MSLSIISTGWLYASWLFN